MRVLITGGAGFIGCNAAAALLRRGYRITVMDNLSRPGARLNLQWLQQQGKLTFVEADVRDASAVEQVVSAGFDAIIHLAAQVAVVSSLADPRHDFEVNALGTLNLLEAMRRQARPPALIFASTNKVYGALPGLRCQVEGKRYSCAISQQGIDESWQLDFHSPYGCSKGAADQYVRDFARCYGLKTAVLRQSCIYGERQFGVEEQGWLAWFTIAALTGRGVTLFGEGKQVRDVLAVGDLVRLYESLLERAEQLEGVVLNVGGGPDNAISLLESLELLQQELGVAIPVVHQPMRTGDQRIFISNNGAAESFAGWRPAVGVREGVGALATWIRGHLPEIKQVLAQGSAGQRR